MSAALAYSEQIKERALKKIEHLQKLILAAESIQSTIMQSIRVVHGESSRETLLAEEVFND